tara:strand:- start:484 stop:801 length:318 start_codon:yes stop_codon:yes gene_type:complete
MITIVVLLTIRDAAAFEQFERQAVAIMVEHGGKLDSAFRPSLPGNSQAAAVDEIHVLKFPNQESFERYKADEQVAALASLREKAIAHTIVYVSAEEIDYSSLESH